MKFSFGVGEGGGLGPLFLNFLDPPLIAETKRGKTFASESRYMKVWTKWCDFFNQSITNKTEAMLFGTAPRLAREKSFNICTDGKQIERVHEFTYISRRRF